MGTRAPHRHVFFAEADGPAPDGEWLCACGLVAVHDGALDGGLVVIAAPAPDEFGALVGTEADPFAELLDVGRAGAARRPA